MNRGELLEHICPNNNIDICCSEMGKIACKECDTVLNTYLDKYDKQIRADAIDSINDNIHEIYKCQFYCMADMCEHDSPTVDRCIDCFYDAIQKSLEQLKEQE